MKCSKCGEECKTSVMVGGIMYCEKCSPYPVGSTKKEEK